MTGLPIIRTWTSKVKYFLRFLMIMTRNGSLMPSVLAASAGHVMKVVLRVEKEILEPWDKQENAK